MSTINFNIDSQIVVQTAAAWGADATVYSNKRMLLTSDLFYTGTDQPRFKFANGVDTWSNLDYVPEGGSDMVSYTFSNTIGSTLADASDYFFGINGALAATVNGGAFVPIKGGTLREVHIETYNASTFGSADGVIVNLWTNGGVDSYNVTNGLLYTDRHIYTPFTGLSEVIVNGNAYIELIAPIFTTNPTATQTRVTIIVEL
jgi:hypothetical protein